MIEDNGDNNKHLHHVQENVRSGMGRWIYHQNIHLALKNGQIDLHGLWRNHHQGYNQPKALLACEKAYAEPDSQIEKTTKLRKEHFLLVWD